MPDCVCCLAWAGTGPTDRERDTDVALARAGGARPAPPGRRPHLRGIRGVLAIIGSVIAGVICAVVAKSKGYGAVLFGILGLIFSIITLIVVLLIPRKR